MVKKSEHHMISVSSTLINKTLNNGTEKTMFLFELRQFMFILFYYQLQIN